jgi:hypothetical protein
MVSLITASIHFRAGKKKLQITKSFLLTQPKFPISQEIKRGGNKTATTQREKSLFYTYSLLDIPKFRNLILFNKSPSPSTLNQSLGVWISY